MQRESFRSRLGFLLVSAGCAIGIGNVWKFPYMAGQGGGGAFVLFYLLFLIILGLPILRGAVTFLDSMIRGVKALMFSADYFPDDKAAQPSKLDLWLEKHVPAEKLQNVLVWVSVLLSLGMTLVLFTEVWNYWELPVIFLSSAFPMT